MKHAADAILRTEQADYLEALNGAGIAALAAMARVAPVHGREPLLAKMEARAAERGYPISDPEVASFLAIVTRLRQPRLVVELGANIGYGAIVMARAAGEGSRVVTIEYRQDLVEEARGFVAEAGLSPRIEVRQGLALAELEKIDEPIDLLYVDCVKEEYPQYLALGAPRLAERGVLVADNVLWRGQVAHESPPETEKARAAALREFNLALVSRPDLCGVVLPLGDGVAFAVKL
ncbi:MAG TPA: O-methyltransferase [Polyangiaceae bacterium]|jgi:predicted O-methyltransferase YrrM